MCVCAGMVFWRDIFQYHPKMAMIDNSKMKLAAARNVCPGSWMFKNSWVIRGPPRTAGLRGCGMGIFSNFLETFGESVQSIIFSNHNAAGLAS